MLALIHTDLVDVKGHRLPRSSFPEEDSSRYAPPETWRLTACGRACLTALFRTLSPYLKSSAPLMKVLFSHGQPLPENRRSFGNKPGLSRTNPSKPCVRLFLSSVHGYLKVTGNCTCVHAAICSGTYVMRGRFESFIYPKTLEHRNGAQIEEHLSVHGQCYRKLRVLPCFLLSGSWSPPGSKNVLVLRCWQKRPSFHF